MREKTNKINIYKINPTLSFEDIKNTPENYTKEFEDTDKVLFVQTGKITSPSWLSYVKDYISSDIKKIINASSSFILIYKHNTNIYALTGGYGHNKIKEYIVEDFGIQLAIRMIDEKNITALNQRSMKGQVRQIYRAVTGYDPAFDRENYTRILNSIEGKTKFMGKTFRIVGKAAIALRTVKSLENINEVFLEIENIATQPEKIHFPRSYRPVTKKELIGKLNSQMCLLIDNYWKGNADRDRLYLEFNDPFTQFRCDKFLLEFSNTELEFKDFDLDVIKETLSENGINEIEAEKDIYKISFTGVNEDGMEEFTNYTFFELLVCEIEIDGKLYIKFGKRWLQILDEIKEFFDKEIQNINVKQNLLPEWNLATHPKELDYNTYVAQRNGWVCMDRDFIYIQGKSKIEICDIFNKSEKQFFHVKKTWGSKSAYLFTQGLTSAESYSNSATCRAECKKKWPKQFDVLHRNCEVVFGIASEKATEGEFPLNMTFFAKLNLHAAATALRQLDYQLTLVPIKIYT